MRLPATPRAASLAIAATTFLVACEPSGAGNAPDALLRPDTAALRAPAPDSFSVVLATSEGEIEIRVRRAWSPAGADRVHYLAQNGFFSGNRVFRVLPGFIAQFGLNGEPAVNDALERHPLPAERPQTGNRRGTLAFAMAASPDTRTTQLFINLADNANLDGMGFAPVGEVIRGMEVVEKFHSAYGEGPPWGRGPDQTLIMRDGNRYLRMNFPRLDTIATATVRP